MLIASSVTMVMAWASLKGRSLPKFRRYMGLTLLCGAIFLVVKTIEYSDKFSHHLYPATSNFLGLYFTMTGLHAIHVIAGMIVNAYFLGPGTKMWQSNPERFTNRIEVAGIYWHFVDVVWNLFVSGAVLALEMRNTSNIQIPTPNSQTTRPHWKLDLGVGIDRFLVSR